MDDETKHECYLGQTAKWEDIKDGKNRFWKCTACDFRGTQEEAIKHTIDNQFVVR